MRTRKSSWPRQVYLYPLFLSIAFLIRRIPILFPGPCPPPLRPFCLSQPCLINLEPFDPVCPGKPLVSPLRSRPIRFIPELRAKVLVPTDLHAVLSAVSRHGSLDCCSLPPSLYTAPPPKHRVEGSVFGYTCSGHDGGMRGATPTDTLCSGFVVHSAKHLRAFASTASDFCNPVHHGKGKKKPPPVPALLDGSR